MHNLDLEGFRNELRQGTNDALKGLLPELSDHICRDLRSEMRRVRSEIQNGWFASEDSHASSRNNPPMHVVVEPPSPVTPWAPKRPPQTLPLNQDGAAINGSHEPSSSSIVKALGRSASSAKLRRSVTNNSLVSSTSVRSKRVAHDWTEHYPRSQLVTQALHMFPMQNDAETLRSSPRPSPRGTPEPPSDDEAQMPRPEPIMPDDSSSERWASPKGADQSKDPRPLTGALMEHKPSLVKERTFLAPLQTAPIKKFTSKRSNNRPILKHAASAWNVATSRVLKLQRILWRTVTSAAFDYIVGFLLVLNAISNGVQVDHMARTRARHLPWTFRLIEILFCVIFAIELGLRILVNGRSFFVGHGWQWNWFDAVIVVLQLLDELMSFIVDTIFGDLYASEYTNFAFVRILRLLRLIRVLRFVRILRLVRELHVMVCSIAGSLRTFLWTCALFALMIYVVGVYFTQLVVDHSHANPETYTKEPNLQNYFGSLGNSVLSLFQATSGGIDWNDLLISLNSISPIMAFVLSAYIAFSTLVMLNLVTGIFVDSARINIVEYKDLDLVNRVRELFVTSDENRSGFITWEEFEKQLKNPQMEAYFKVLDLDLSEAHGLFYLLDIHNSGEINSEDFVNGCLGLRGSAKAIDMKTLMFNSKRMFQLLVESSQRIEDCLESFTNAVMALEDNKSQMETISNMC